MKKVIVDANIIINVWREEIDPASGKKLFLSSQRILEQIAGEKLDGILLTTTALEILHKVRTQAVSAGHSPDLLLKSAEKKLSKTGLILTIPDASIMGMAYDLFFVTHTDPFDAIMVAAAVVEKADAIISRDRKLKKKASKIIPVLSPEEFLV